MRQLLQTLSFFSPINRIQGILKRVLQAFGFAGAILAQQSVAVLLLPAVFTPAMMIPGENVYAQCAEAPQLQNFTGGGMTVCPCFVPGEEAGVVFDAPPADYPLEILRIGIGWGSQFGGNPAQIEQAIHVYHAAGLPDPGAPIFSLVGPQLTDGVINLFNIEPIQGEVVITQGSFTVSLEFLNQSSVLAPSVVHDGNGCTAAKNVVKAIPGGWIDACLAGVTGDWVFFVVYRPCVTATGIGDTPKVLSSTPVELMPAQPNPFQSSTDFNFFLADAGRANVSVFDVKGRRVATLVDNTYASGIHQVIWDGRGDRAGALPSGMYFVKLQSAGQVSTRKVLLRK